jgi:hypothetical protein
VVAAESHDVEARPRHRAQPFGRAAAMRAGQRRHALTLSRARDFAIAENKIGSLKKRGDGCERFVRIVAVDNDVADSREQDLLSHSDLPPERC